MITFRKISISAGVVLLAVFFVYTIFWFIVAAQINKQIETLWVSMSAGGAKIEGEKPSVYGYPFPPAVTFSGQITEQNGTLWTFPELSYHGFPVAGFSMALDAPKGFSLQGVLFPQPIKVDEGYIYVTLPRNLPANMNVAHLRSWQQAGGHIPIDALLFKSGNLLIRGNGFFSLDDKLQLAGEVDARIDGMDDLLQELSTRGILKGGSVSMAQSFLTALSQQDPETGSNYFITQIKIQKRGVFFGPLRIGFMPEIVWDSGEKVSE